MTSSFILFHEFEIEANKSCCVPVHVVITRVENKHSQIREPQKTWRNGFTIHLYVIEKNLIGIFSNRLYCMNAQI